MDVAGTPCGKKHNCLLHGRSYIICNLMIRKVSNPSTHSLTAHGAPTLAELDHMDLANNSLLPMLNVEVMGPDGVHTSQTKVFCHMGSNINLVSKDYAEGEGWKGTPVT